MKIKTTTRIICFSDIKDSTKLTEHLGHQKYMPLIKDHLRVAKALTLCAEGHYVKNVGDANLVCFDGIEDALSFVVQLQEYYEIHPSLRGSGLQLKISLCKGDVVESTNGEITDAYDVFGSAVNIAARLEGKSESGMVVVNAELVTQAKSALGISGDNDIFYSVGEHELKGISDPAKQKLFLFDWEKYKEENSSSGLKNLVLEHLDTAKIELSNFDISNMGENHQIIWPVVPRDLVTAIHRAQIEVIRLLTLLGMNITILISDCGGNKTYEPSYVSDFKTFLKKHLQKRDIREVDIILLSNLYNTSSPEYQKLQDVFRTVSSIVSVQDLMSINQKTYSDEVKREVEEDSMLTHIRPLLTIAAVLYIANAKGSKCAIISGQDELLQWQHAYNVPGADAKIGALMIPNLTRDKNHLLRQKERYPIWDSKNAIERDINESNNYAWWLFHLHAFLPAFPEKLVTDNDNGDTYEVWSDKLKVPDKLSLDTLAKLVWPILNPN